MNENENIVPIALQVMEWDVPEVPIGGGLVRQNTFTGQLNDFVDETGTLRWGTAFDQMTNFLNNIDEIGEADEADEADEAAHYRAWELYAIKMYGSVERALRKCDYPWDY